MIPAENENVSAALNATLHWWGGNTEHGYRQSDGSGLGQDLRDGHLLFEFEMYLQKGCIMVSGVESIR